MAAARPRMDISADPEALAHRVAQWITDLACHAGGRFSIALSGGSTPKRLYQLLAGAPYKDVLPWERVHWFFGDDRFVPWDAPESNYGMAREAMLAHAPIPSANIHGIVYEGTLSDAARICCFCCSLRARAGRLLGRHHPIHFGDCSFHSG